MLSKSRAKSQKNNTANPGNALLIHKSPRRTSDVKKTPATEARTFRARLDALLQRPQCEIHTGHIIGDECKTVTVRFPPKLVRRWPHLEISHITDTQFGHVFADYARMARYRDWILKDPYRYMVWGGDMIDAWRMGSPGEPWENLFAPDKQISRFCEFWAPAAHRVLGYVGGNHERRGIVAFGDLGKLISYLLGIPYSSGQQFVDVHYGDHSPFTIALWHGRGAARTAGAKLNMLVEFMRQNKVDMTFVGHLHSAFTYTEARICKNPATSKLELIKYCGAMSSSFLEYFGTYGEKVAFNPTVTMMARLILERKGKGWEVTTK
jgi:hypothetical protein